jgi:3-dehydroquinate dehydratase-2
MRMKLLILNGPNLNLLGQREPDVYGTLTLTALNRQIAEHIEELNVGRPQDQHIEAFFSQSNHEGVLVDTLQSAQRAYEGIVYNPAAHTHYSVALRDAIAGVPTPVVEVHLSDIATREEFRHISLMEDVCIAQFKGEGAASYLKAVDYLVDYLDSTAE